MSHLHPDRGGQHHALLRQQMSSVWEGRHLPTIVQTLITVLPMNMNGRVIGEEREDSY